LLLLTYSVGRHAERRDQALARAGLRMILETESGTFDLTAGRYVLVCNLVQDEPDGTRESHYLMGMAIEFTVK
jgi:hypothetical protein